MRRLLIPVATLLFAGCASWQVDTDYQPLARQVGYPLRIGSFNIHFDEIEGGRWSWPGREQLVREVILAEQPDIIGLQEVTSWDGMDLVASRQIPDLEKMLPEYGFAGARPLDGLLSSNPILYRKERFDLISTGALYFSRDPYSEPSSGWQTLSGRFARWALLQERETGRQILVANAHYSPIRPGHRRMSSRVLINELPTLAEGAPIVIVGDLNAFPDWREVVELCEQLGLKDAHASVVGGTLHGGNMEYGWGRIDFVLSAKELGESFGWISQLRPTGLFASDHFPVFADFAWGYE